jgi:hypothetical protein
MAAIHLSWATDAVTSPRFRTEIAPTKVPFAASR